MRSMETPHQTANDRSCLSYTTFFLPKYVFFSQNLDGNQTQALDCNQPTEHVKMTSTARFTLGCHDDASSGATRKRCKQTRRDETRRDVMNHRRAKITSKLWPTEAGLCGELGSEVHEVTRTLAMLSATAALCSLQLANSATCDVEREQGALTRT